MPGLVNVLGGGWAFIGDAYETTNPTTGVNGKVQDAWLLVNRLLYAF